jgi:hypothetical protein
MGWFLQTPDSASPKLLQQIINGCGTAQRGAAAFAFASAQGIRLLSAEPVFAKFLQAKTFEIIVGLDAITDTRAVDELRKISKTYPNFKPKLFLHEVGGSIFHPKTLWLATDKGGLILTGSGNLTTGGLKSNWEALTVETLDPASMKVAEKNWSDWLASHAKQLLGLDDPKALAKAEANGKLRAKLRKAIKAPAKEAEPDEEVADAVLVELEGELNLNPMLLAEVPKGSDRWEQVNFDKKSFEEFFVVTLGVAKSVRFFHLQPDGSPVAEPVRPPVAVKSKNYRFELKAAKGKDYPAKGVPIGVFERVSDTDFNYVLLMPGEEGHTLVANYLDAIEPKKPNRLRRRQLTAGDVKKIWPKAPFFL